jgi:anthranilate synthase component II
VSVVLLIDNYDSFTYNLAHGLAEQGASVRVFRNDAIDTATAETLGVTHLVISPGPGRPSETGVSAALVAHYHRRVAILGVCLGHQLIVELAGGRVEPAVHLVHGKATIVDRIADDALLDGLPDAFEAGRYHSLVAVDPLPAGLIVTARARDGEIMAARYVDAPTHGVQFHPESVLTPLGSVILRNFLGLVVGP